ncbi:MULTISPECIES: hypothetical protein [Vibrio]|uniref:hypothetical protein n=1 Tax=Vibrio TaxID=662 RepID=UPI000639A6BE|nr:MULTISPECIES: hypothetical protein [Vibrio]PMI73923.1 hypothetical protein BCU38_16495 [Vibrio splendidus]CDT41780.1 hypothetical protein VCR6J2_420034 [Vibrio coralliirubri]CDT93275.1 hypothetical protein VCR8J2_480015 [Vibrio coralliirubri]
MDLFSSSPVLLNAAIKTKIKQIFLFGIDTNYQVDEQWLEQATDTLIYTFNTKKQAVNEVIGLEDDDIIDECVEAIVIQLCHIVEKSISEVKAIS